MGRAAEGALVDLRFEPYKEAQLAQRHQPYVREAIYPPPGPRDDYACFAYYSAFGCPLQCTFCCSPGVSGLRWKAKAGDAVADELAELSERYGFDTVRYYDANYSVLEQRVADIAHGLLSRGKRLAQSGYCQSQSISRYDPSTLEAMKESGFYHILLGGETGSEETMRMVKKTTRGDENIAAARALSDVGITVYMTYVIGFPHETEQSMWSTLNEVRRIHSEVPPAAPEVWPFRPIPGAPTYQEAIDLGYEPPTDLFEWGDMGEYRFQRTWEAPIPERVMRHRALLGHFVSVARGERGTRGPVSGTSTSSSSSTSTTNSRACWGGRSLCAATGPGAARRAPGPATGTCSTSARSAAGRRATTVSAWRAAR